MVNFDSNTVVIVEIMTAVINLFCIPAVGLCMYRARHKADFATIRYGALVYAAFVGGAFIIGRIFATILSIAAGKAIHVTGFAYSILVLVIAVALPFVIDFCKAYFHIRIRAIPNEHE